MKKSATLLFLILFTVCVNAQQKVYQEMQTPTEAMFSIVDCNIPETMEVGLIVNQLTYSKINFFTAIYPNSEEEHYFGTAEFDDDNLKYFIYLDNPQPMDKVYFKFGLFSGSKLYDYYDGHEGTIDVVITPEMAKHKYLSIPIFTVNNFRIVELHIK